MEIEVQNKQTLVNLISLQASLATYIMQIENQNAKKNFQLSAQLIQEVIDALQAHV